MSTALGRLPSHTGILSVRRNRDIPHTLAVGDIVHHKGMLGVERIGHSLRGINRDTDGVGIFRLSQILYGKGVVVGGEFQLGRGGMAVNIEFVVLGPLHLYLAFQIIAVVHIE